MSALIHNFNRRGVNADAKHRISTSIESAIDLTRPEKATSIELQSHYKVITLSLVFIVCLFSQTTLLAESELAKDISSIQSGSIEPVTVDEESTATSHTEKLRNNFIDLANSLNEITSPSDASDSAAEEKEHSKASLSAATGNTENLRNNFIDLANSLNEITSTPATGDAAIVEENTEASITDATENSRSNFIDLANSLKEITSTPVPAEEFVAQEEPEKIIKTKITAIDKVVIKHKPVTVKLVAADKPDEALKPVISSAEPVITAAGTKNPYNKYDANGNLLDSESEQWACIHDTSNDLMWEVKSKDDTLRNSNNLYSWFDPKNKKLKGKPDGGRCEGGTECDTNAYVQAMNEKNFCGHNDWQLPTRGEMQTLVYLNNQKDPVKINKQYFPETVPSWYWTASENEESKDFAWYVLFRNGVALNDLKERPKHIRLVRYNNTQ